MGSEGRVPKRRVQFSLGTLAMGVVAAGACVGLAVTRQGMEKEYARARAEFQRKLYEQEFKSDGAISQRDRTIAVSEARVKELDEAFAVLSEGAEFFNENRFMAFKSAPVQGKQARTWRWRVYAASQRSFEIKVNVEYIGGAERKTETVLKGSVKKRGIVELWAQIDRRADGSTVLVLTVPKAGIAHLHELTLATVPEDGEWASRPRVKVGESNGANATEVNLLTLEGALESAPQPRVKISIVPDAGMK